MDVESGSRGRTSARRWISLVAALAAAAVAIVFSVTRTEEPRAERTSSPGPSPAVTTPTPSAPANVAVPLRGKGPYIVFSRFRSEFDSYEIHAYDIASDETTSMGYAEGSPFLRSRQPEPGNVVAFASTYGNVWSITREVGLRRVASFSIGEGTGIEGSAVSADGRRIATGVGGDDPALLIVNLESGRTLRFPRGKNIDTLAPIIWAENGSILYEVPICSCGGGMGGVYRYDLRTEQGSMVEPIGDLHVSSHVVATPDGKTVVYGTSTENAPCPNGGPKICAGPPFELRRLTADGRSSFLLRRDSSRNFEVLLMSDDGRTVLVRRRVPNSLDVRLERIDVSSGERVGPSGTFGLDPEARIQSELPDGTWVAYNQHTGRLFIVREAGNRVIARSRNISYLGWLR